nr:hypothetical protein [Tanacetum cinerariifolium]
SNVFSWFFKVVFLLLSRNMKTKKRKLGSGCDKKKHLGESSKKQNVNEAGINLISTPMPHKFRQPMCPATVAKSSMQHDMQYDFTISGGRTTTCMSNNVPSVTRNNHIFYQPPNVSDFCGREISTLSSLVLPLQ